MQQYRLEFFKNHYAANAADRCLMYVHHDFVDDVVIDDDYLAIQTTIVAIRATDKVKVGHVVRVLRDNEDYFFCIVTDVSAGEYTTQITFKPFISIFDEDVLFNILDQYWMDANKGKTLEASLKKYIEDYYVNNSDAIQDWPMTVTIPAARYQTSKWSMNIRGDDEESAYAIIGLYSTLLVRALKEYGVSVRFSPNFSTGKIDVTISKISDTFNVAADLDNVTVKTFKVNDRPIGLNKLTVFSTLTYEAKNYYVHPNPEEDIWWDKNNSNRITPVIRGLRAVTPDGTYSDDPDVDFEYAAEMVALDELSGIEWDNLIELECIPNDNLVKPSSLRIGQKVTVYYKGTGYTSILTGRSVSYDRITLIFGSERISYTKKKTSK